MASEETELSVGIHQKSDQKAFLTVETHIPGSGYKGKLNNDSDDHSLQDMSEGPKNDGTLHALSGLYAQIVVVIAAILVFTELLHRPVPLFFFDRYVFIFLIGGAILCFICAYVTILTSKCPRWINRSYGEKSYNASFSSRFVKNLLFSDISIYLRIGSVVFGIGALISSGLEVASILTIPNDCMDKMNLLQPILRGLFSFLQMHFLFMSSKEMVNSFRWVRHTALMHLVATNLAIWIRVMLWESTKDWLDALHYKHNSSVEWDLAKFNITMHTLDSDEKHIDTERHKPYHRIHVTTSRQCNWAENLEKDDAEGIIAYHICMQNSTIGAIWEKATPYLYPLTVQYSLVAAAVIYITWTNLHTQRSKLQRFAAVSVYGKDPSSSSSSEDVNCSGSTRGLFLGLLVLVVGLIGLILFFVLAHETDFNVLFLIASLEIGIFGLSTLAAIIGLLQIRKMKSKTSRQRRLLELLQRVGMLAVYIYGICNIIVGGVSMTSLQNFLLFLHGTLMVTQACLQSLFIYQISKKRLSPLNLDEKPGRQVVIFLVFINLVLWILESFTTQNQVRYELQLKFFGYIAWPVITRIFLPLVILYRFHSAVALMEAWRKSYKIKQN
ncbi:proton channel OtopLc-like isoform X2 [Uloborus diversus]|nr:proton channel OtopLc-like isoform X2 [Uloborus diversus]